MKPSKRFVIPLAIVAIVSASECEREVDYRQLTDGTCTYGYRDLGGDVRYVIRRENWRELNLKDPPPKSKRVRKSDLRRYPRARFSILLEDNHGNRIDTSSETATIDMVTDPDTTITLQFSAAEIDTIYQGAMAMRIFNYPEPHPVLETMKGGMCPDVIYHLRVTAGSEVRELRWATHYWPGGKTLDDWRRLYDLVALIERMRAARPEYQALPKPRGAYM